MTGRDFDKKQVNPANEMENCVFRTPNIGLRNYRISNIDFTKMTFETLSL